MNDNTPLPMPAEVLRTYPMKIDYVGLLEDSRVYSDNDRAEVLGGLTRALVARYGDVRIRRGDGSESVSEIVRGMRSDAASAIELLRSIDQYGGAAGVDPLLAMAMQPRWARWWGSFEWRNRDDIEAWRDVTGRVLGQLELAWLAAQYARSAIDRLAPRDRQVCLAAIEAAEAAVRDPSKVNHARAIDASDRAATTASLVSDVAAQHAARASVYAARAASDAAGYNDQVARAAWNAAEATVAYGRLAAMTKTIVSPTLVMDASRPSRPSGSTQIRTALVIAGAAVGTGAAVLLSKRR